MTDEILEYELIDIAFELNYEDVVLPTLRVCEDGPDGPQIEYDEDGVPMGDTVQEIEQRQAIIVDFLEKWGQANPIRGVYNDKLEEIIYVRGISVIEAKEHSSKSYYSTRAIMILDEVLKEASPIKRVPKKEGNKNQKDFEYMLIMLYKHPEYGSVKLTLGVRKNSMKVQYGMTVLRPGQPLIDETTNKKSSKTKKRKPPK